MTQAAVQELTIRRLTQALNKTTDCLHDLATHIDWGEDGAKAVLDTDGLQETWDRVERLLTGPEGQPVTEAVSTPGSAEWCEAIVAHAQAAKAAETAETAAAPREERPSLFARARQQLRAVHGLDLDRPLPDLERQAWTRELALDVLASVGQLFDRMADVCLAREEMARWRRRKAMDALIRVLQLAQLHGVAEETLLRELGPESPAACGACGGSGRVAVKGRYLGEPDTERPCSECSPE